MCFWFSWKFHSSHLLICRKLELKEWWELKGRRLELEASNRTCMAIILGTSTNHKCVYQAAWSSVIRCKKLETCKTSNDSDISQSKHQSFCNLPHTPPTHMHENSYNKNVISNLQKHRSSVIVP